MFTKYSSHFLTKGKHYTSGELSCHESDVYCINDHSLINCAWVHNKVCEFKSSWTENVRAELIIFFLSEL